MKISFLVQDLSDNASGRAYLLAKILQKHFKIEIVGPMFGGEIWPPLSSDKSIEYKYVRIKGKIKPYLQLMHLSRQIEGTIVYAFQPLFATLGMGLLHKIVNNRPLILDIDDWQYGFLKEQYNSRPLGLPSLRVLAFSALNFYKIDSYWNALFFDKMTCCADEITVASTWLKEKFSGTVIYHARDTELFNPDKFDKSLIRKEYGISDNNKIIMFFGTPRSYKGIEDLITAVKLAGDNNIVLVVVGINDNDLYAKNLAINAKKILGEQFRLFPWQDFEKVPKFLAMADLVVIPQRSNYATVGQVPAKIFDAMAMAKPIIATSVSDNREILNDCGWIVEPQNPKQLSEAIRHVFENPQTAKERGSKARQRCIERYSYKAAEKVLLGIFKKHKAFQRA
ncbi:MAG: glycosyltransferase family 4 protein [Candidatus Omnitrophica bacterium]|nr:glycosyltransferase family 4 protein [Candidatus Omnitrophota bacterium]